MSNEPKDEPDFQINHAKQLEDALNLLVRHASLRRRHIINTDYGVPFYFTPKQLIYRDPLIKQFVENWKEMNEIDRTFYMVKSQKKFEQEYNIFLMKDMYDFHEMLEMYEF